MAAAAAIKQTAQTLPISPRLVEDVLIHCWFAILPVEMVITAGRVRSIILKFSWETIRCLLIQLNPPASRTRFPDDREILAAAKSRYQPVYSQDPDRFHSSRQGHSTRNIIGPRCLPTDNGSDLRTTSAPARLPAGVLPPKREAAAKQPDNRQSQTKPRPRPGGRGLVFEPHVFRCWGNDHAEHGVVGREHRYLRLPNISPPTGIVGLVDHEPDLAAVQMMRDPSDIAIRQARARRAAARQATAQNKISNAHSRKYRGS